MFPRTERARTHQINNRTGGVAPDHVKLNCVLITSILGQL
ncbi:unnamed protein product [Brassica rapa]|uniref:Uncharacterized protein n=1 Tax=Brassica campestris TaxID=3711 RepID=A0A3P6A5V6_BRACM|nr:unnamed protein product [Brassica rapa]VDC87417.1 unnamed protein product [Brassica rapa]